MTSVEGSEPKQLMASETQERAEHTETPDGSERVVAAIAPDMAIPYEVRELTRWHGAQHRDWRFVGDGIAHVRDGHGEVLFYLPTMDELMAHHEKLHGVWRAPLDPR